MPPRRRADLVVQPTEGGGGLLACDLCRRWPTLAEFLACSVYDDGSEREPGTLLVCVSEGRWRGWLNDRGQGAAAWVSGSTFDALMDSLEDGLLSNALEWRRARKAGSSRRG